MKTLVIAPEDDFRNMEPRFRALGLDDVERIEPVYTKDTCAGSRGETGCFRAHKNAWRKCSEQNTDRCLVLEHDWTYGNQDPSHVRSELHNLPTNSDYFLVGHCGNYTCTHAYTITKDHAKELSAVDECSVKMAVDLYMGGRCRTGISRCAQYGDNPQMEGCVGSGLIQQDRINIRGMHDHHNNGTCLKHGDCPTVNGDGGSV